MFKPFWWHHSFGTNNYSQFQQRKKHQVFILTLDSLFFALIMSLVAHPLICKCAEFWILHNIFYVLYFPTPQNQFKTEKKEFNCSNFSCLNNKKSIFLVKSKHKKIHYKYSKFQLTITVLVCLDDSEVLSSNFPGLKNPLQPQKPQWHQWPQQPQWSQLTWWFDHP